MKPGQVAVADLLVVTKGDLAPDPASLENAIASLQASFGPGFLPMTGLVEIEGYPSRPRLLQVVGHVSSPQRLLDGWPEGIGATRIVMIVSGPGRDAAPDVLRKFLPELHTFSPDLKMSATARH